MGATRLKLVVLEAPFKIAVMVADWVVVIVPTVAVKVVEAPWAGTVTDAGTVSAVLLLESVTALPPVGADSFRVTVQVVDAPELTLLGLHARAETTAGSTKLNVVLCKVPFKVAVTVAVWFAGRTPAVAMKLAELDPEGTVADAGIVRRMLLSDNVTVAPDEAVWFKLTVQVVEAPEVKVPGLQLNDVKPSGKTAVIVPPVAVMGSALADWVAPNAFVMPIDVAAVLGEIVAVTTATTPFWMMFALGPFTFSPDKKQVYMPGLPIHDRGFPAAVAAAPGLALIATMSVGE